MSRRPDVRATRLAPMVLALRLHDQATRARAAGECPGYKINLASIEYAWVEALRRMSAADVAELLHRLADPLPVDPRGRVVGGWS